MIICLIASIARSVTACTVDIGTLPSAGGAPSAPVTASWILVERTHAVGGGSRRSETSPSASWRVATTVRRERSVSTSPTTNSTAPATIRMVPSIEASTPGRSKTRAKREHDLPGVEASKLETLLKIRREHDELQTRGQIVSAH